MKMGGEIVRTGLGDIPDVPQEGGNGVHAQMKLGSGTFPEIRSRVVVLSCSN